MLLWLAQGGIEEAESVEALSRSNRPKDRLRRQSLDDNRRPEIDYSLDLQSYRDGCRAKIKYHRPHRHHELFSCAHTTAACCINGGIGDSRTPD